MQLYAAGLLIYQFKYHWIRRYYIQPMSKKK